MARAARAAAGLGEAWTHVRPHREPTPGDAGSMLTRSGKSCNRRLWSAAVARAATSVVAERPSLQYGPHAARCATSAAAAASASSIGWQPAYARNEAAARRHKAVHSCSAVPRRFAASSRNARRATRQPLPRSSNKAAAERCGRPRRLTQYPWNSLIVNSTGSHRGH